MPSPTSPPQTRTSLSQEILALAIPAFATLVSEPLLLMADSAMVGHLGTRQLAGLGLASSVLNIINGLCVFLAYGTTSLVARRIGAGDSRRALAGGIDGMALGLGLGSLLAVVLNLTAPTVIGWYGAGPEVSSQAVDYLRIACWGLPMLLLMLASTGVLRGMKDTRTPLAVAVSMNLANIGLNALFMYGMGMGIRGSATGTLLAQAIGASVLTAVVLRGAVRAGVPLGVRVHGVLEAARGGVWLVMRSAWLQASLAVTVAVAARTGQVGLAGHQVTNSIWSFLCLALDALAIAAQAMVGHELGRGDAGKVRSITAKLCWWGVAGGLVFAAGLVLVRGVLAPVFTPDAEVQQLLVRLLLVLALITPIGGIVFVLDGVLIGAGDARYLAFAGMVATLAYVPMALAVDHAGRGVIWLWLAYGGYLLARVATLALRARSDAWMRLGA
ncbi:putative MATE family efflux protein [Luteococcus japonicus]|uniref:Putative MATE family efflux protein n=1 Tax=Luteococcus japonicus TaxID=33984 RepID=A0A3N1ZVT0_9ACTN|nr:MATE family efflux transporter [Luteococcus japonicus]ROR54878.1 putative MATE family efflux protein [Luteococcus japonicus]